MSANPNFSSTPILGQGIVSTANTNLDGTGTLATVLTAGSAGSRIGDITIKALGTTTAGMVRFFFYDGTNTRLIHEETVSAITASGTVPSFETTFSLNQSIPATILLKASTHNAESFAITVYAGNY